jgi:hypothetical protein
MGVPFFCAKHPTPDGGQFTHCAQFVCSVSLCIRFILSEQYKRLHDVMVDVCMLVFVCFLGVLHDRLCCRGDGPGLMLSLRCRNPVAGLLHLNVKVGQIHHPCHTACYLKP